MHLSNEQFVIDANGNQVAVLLDVGAYHRLLEDLEELEAIRAYDEAKNSDDEAVPFEQAMEEIERERE